MIHFAWPWVFLLIPLPLLLRIYPSEKQSAVMVPPDLEQALDAIQSTSKARFRWQLVSLWCAWLLSVIVIAQPWTPGDAVAQPVSGRALALAVDVSTSMNKQDFQLDGKSDDRLSVVKNVARQFINARSGDRLSLVLYGKEAFIASPLTFDLNALSSILDGAGIGMAGNSTAIGDAIGLAIQTLNNDPARTRAIVLLSDGTNNAGSVEPESAAELANSLGIRIHTIALGSEDGEISGYAMAQSADLDEDTLRSVAQSSGGRFFRARSSKDLDDVYRAIDELERADVIAPPVILQTDLRVWPLSILGLLLIAVATRRRSQA